MSDSTNLLIEEARWQLEKFDKLSFSLSTKLIACAENQEKRISELKETLSFVRRYFDEPARRVDAGYTKQVIEYIDSLLEPPR